MKKSRFNEEKMVKILREADKSPVSRVAKKFSVSEQTIYACDLPMMIRARG
jgi:putative transposase